MEYNIICKVPNEVRDGIKRAFNSAFKARTLDVEKAKWYVLGRITCLLELDQISVVDFSKLFNYYGLMFEKKEV